ncbi:MULTISPECIES: hypothetical protein [unclassified Mesorhizobium]|uniref:hypothetical protein n=1 Tax=unclassified Mesorhizobium TaxID=325217 RepID=UPI002416E988|nr:MULTISPECIES: hypothetical protein [unclassified Mesorhizobium]WFP65738.1 hypothetical protein QAZ47_14935 [Mesorhizobium sp. WSM4904]WFP79000.1 hypothetical protein QAZ22_14870 [Mesorhizobium sp. WSM4906]
MKVTDSRSGQVAAFDLTPENVAHVEHLGSNRVQSKRSSWFPGNISSGQKIELAGEVVRLDEDTVTVGGKDLGLRSSAVLCAWSPAMSRRSGRHPPDRKSPSPNDTSDGLKLVDYKLSGPGEMSRSLSKLAGSKRFQAAAEHFS